MEYILNNIYNTSTPRYPIRENDRSKSVKVAIDNSKVSWDEFQAHFTKYAKIDLKKFEWYFWDARVD